jgi:uncharacterized repeat protein (TIGR01451 family)
MGSFKVIIVVMSMLLVPVSSMGASSCNEDIEQNNPLDGGMEPLSSAIRLWEAWAKGDAEVFQTSMGSYGGTYTVYNNGGTSIIIDEYILCMSPSPAYMSDDNPYLDDETQDGILTTTHTILPGSYLVYKYGNYVAMGLEDPPPWWCTEDSEYTNSGVEISLSGEILPYALVPVIENYTTSTQDDLWYQLRHHETLVIGKLPLWKEIDNIGDEVNITLEITNIGFQNATDIVVTDKIPPGFSYDHLSFTKTPSSITTNPDSSISIEWEIDGMRAAIETPSDEPTDYEIVYIGYKLITPYLDADKRIFLPRAYVDKNGNGNNDAESEEPLLETLLVNSPPVAVVNDENINEGDFAFFDGSSSYDPDPDDYIASYEWDFDGDGITDENGSTVNRRYGDNGVFYATLTVTDSYGASSSETSTITVENVNPYIWPISDQRINDGEFGDFEAEATDPGSDDLTFTWSWDDGSSDTVSVYYNNGVSPDPYPSPDINPMDIVDKVTHKFPTEGLYIVTLAVEDDDGGTHQRTFRVRVLDSVPVADFNWSPKPQYEGSPVQFIDQSTSSPDDIVSWEWDFDGLGSNTSQNPSFIFMDDGVYAVTLTVEDDDGSIDSVTKNVTIIDRAPQAEFTWDPEPQNEGSKVQFTDLSTAYPGTIVAWHWDFAGQGTSNQQHPDWTFMDDGIYTVTLTVRDDDDSTQSVSHDVTILDLAPKANFVWSPDPQNEGSPVQFTDTSTSYPDSIVGRSWDFAGLGSSLLPNPSFTFMDDGFYNVILIVTDDDGSTGAIMYTIEIRDLAPTANFTWSPEPQNEGSPVQFTDLSSSYPDIIVSWDWDFDGLDISLKQHPSFIFMDDGTYSVTLTVTDDDGSTNSVSKTVTILDLAPTADFMWAPEPQDEGYPVKFTDLSTSYPDDLFKWSWDFGDGGSNTNQNPFHIYGDDGTYLVTLTVTDDDGSTDSISYNVTILNVAPTVDAGENQTINEGTSVLLTALYFDPGWLDTHEASVDWGDGISEDITLPSGGNGTVLGSHVYGDDGVFTVTVTVTDDDGGVGSDSFIVTVLNVAPSIQHQSKYITDENQEITLSARATDPGSDDLTFTWDWGDGTSDTVTIYYNNGVSPDPYPSPEVNPMDITDSVTHTYGDDGNFTVSLTVVDDDGGVSVYTTYVVVNNVAPAIEPVEEKETNENQAVTLSATATDQGSDDLTFTWDWGDGTSDTVTIYYNNGVGPDPYPSPDINPMDITDTVSHTYGDDGTFTVTLTVEDDDGGVTVVTTTVTVYNVAPMIDTLLPYETDENLDVSLSGRATDPGSDDLIFTWDWGDGTSDTVTIYYNDGVSPDPYPSPEINPRDITDMVAHIYGDNGIFMITLTVEDDDGGISVITTNVTVYNVAPSIYVDRGIKEVDENSPITLSGHITDPGSDDLTCTWDWGDGTSDTITVYFNNGLSPDPYPSPEINPMDLLDAASHVYGDNGDFDVTLTVEDDDGGVISIIINVIVNNVAPTVEVEAFMYVDLTLRIAGEKYHSVGIHLMEDGEDVLAAMVTRRPGNPDEQTGSILGARIDVTKTYTVLIDYLPNDPRVNGNVWGANPVWIEVGFEDGTVNRLHHTFNVRQSDWNSDHWNHIDPWEVELNPLLLGHNITLKAQATDPGSDDLIFTWDFGDGVTAGPTTYYNNGVSPDPYPSPEINPMTATDSCVHSYTTAGTYTITLVVEDDDGGITVTTLEIGF